MNPHDLQYWHIKAPHSLCTLRVCIACACFIFLKDEPRKKRDKKERVKPVILICTGYQASARFACNTSRLCRRLLSLHAYVQEADQILVVDMPLGVMDSEVATQM